MKAKRFRISGTGFLQKSDERVELELYDSIGPLARVVLKPGRVCLEGRCMDSGQFARRYLGYNEPELLYHILKGEPIFDGQNLTEGPDGFSQRIKTKRLDIIYEVKPGEVYFKDRANGILIKLKELDG